jgi:hypothetical protein
VGAGVGVGVADVVALPPEAALSVTTAAPFAGVPFSGSSKV